MLSAESGDGEAVDHDPYAGLDEPVPDDPEPEGGGEGEPTGLAASSADPPPVKRYRGRRGGVSGDRVRFARRAAAAAAAGAASEGAEAARYWQAAAATLGGDFLVDATRAAAGAAILSAFVRPAGELVMPGAVSRWLGRGGRWGLPSRRRRDARVLLPDGVLRGAGGRLRLDGGAVRSAAPRRGGLARRPCHCDWPGRHLQSVRKGGPRGRVWAGVPREGGHGLGELARASHP